MVVKSAVARIFVDTQIFTLFRFLKEPDSFIPPNEGQPGRFVITSPVVAELEMIKDEHFSKGQRDRAKEALGYLEEADRRDGVRLTERSTLEYYWQEASEGMAHGYGFRIYGQDARFIAAIMHAQDQSLLPFWVLSDDVGVRVRVKHIFNKGTAYAPLQALRYAPESFNLPQLVKGSVRELARALADELRQADAK